MPDTVEPWAQLDPALLARARDAREQVHHALQFASAFGISCVERRSDDSHTNLGWSPALHALVSRAARGAQGDVALGLRVADLTLLIVGDGLVRDELPLHGHTIAEAVAAIGDGLTRAGIDGRRYSIARHFTIPHHAVAAGVPFDAGNRVAYAALGDALSNANQLLQVVAATNGGSEVRLWPHHADIATLITVAPGRSTGAGLALGDGYYEDPYLYVNAYPTPARDALPETLTGGGSWHTHEWVGAVLPLTRLAPEAQAQQAQAREFLASAVTATTALLRAPSA